MIFNLAGGGMTDIGKILDDDSKWAAWNLISGEDDFGTIYYMVTASRIFFKGTTKVFSINSYKFDLPQKIIDAVGSKKYEIPVIEVYESAESHREFTINKNTSDYYLHSLYVQNHRTVKLNSWIDI